ncbi:hypothetical protein [Chryseobacterium daecheongense]|uniref:O-antigen ligase domain-containing protein n=1 Tax=Chryseobacterium daecheongense TaxID=192389 RepID=A0A3N0W6X8_9FLAO|nr:hypothetical protein [Chryseobacterium daecheongense]ROI00541.1 hypothetical protein EGI05_06565 [Chryseobacterium daecheongense]TDX94481.1 hypothetical protein BCF50_0249 [Chryseobacterium daecheongense]
MHYNIKKQNFKYYIYILFIIMLSNGLLFNYLFVGFSIWRQLIWLVGFTFFIIFLFSNFKFIKKQKVFTHFRWSLIILLIYLLFALVVKEYNVVRVFYAVILYLFGYSFLTLPFIVVNLKKEIPFFKILSWLGIFISIGLIIDGINNHIFFFLKAYASEVSIEDFKLNRASFLSESPTVFGMSLLLFLISNLYTSHLSKSKFWQIFYILTSFIFLAGAWFSGARQIFFILLFTEIIFFIYKIYKDISKLLIFLFLILPVLILTFKFINPNVDDTNITKYSERFTSDTDGGNATRIEAWTEGVDQFSLNNLSLFTGHGLSYTMGQQALPNEEVGYHMESSIWAIFSEGSIFLWFVFFWPWAYSVKLWLKMKSSLFKWLVFCFLISYIFTGFISPNSSHPLASMSLFIIMGLLINFEKADVKLLQKLKLQ